MSGLLYNRKYFEQICPPSLESAEIVVPILLKIVHPKKVVDVGCGTGAWLSVFHKLGVKEIKGLDGEYVDRSLLMMDRRYFTAVNLVKPFHLNETFDMALCLEVAEHLPARSAERFVYSLSQLAPLIFFSAAVPGQGGTSHVNEQWPDYWEQLFLKHEFLMLDPIRPIIWQDNRVDFTYRQNMFLFARKDIVGTSTELSRLAEIKNDLTLIHVDILKSNLQFQRSLRRLPKRAWANILKRLGYSDNRIPS